MRRICLWTLSDGETFTSIVKEIQRDMIRVAEILHTYKSNKTRSKNPEISGLSLVDGLHRREGCPNKSTDFSVGALSLKYFNRKCIISFLAA